MRTRNGARGPFFGCTKYPMCNGTRNMSGGGSASRGSANDTPSRGWSGPKRLTSKYDGRCSKCNGEVEAGDSILYADRKIVGCEACSPGALAYGASVSASAPAGAPTDNAALANAPLLLAFDDTPTPKNWLDLLVEGDVAPEPIVLALPESRETLEALPKAGFQLDEHQERVVHHRNGEAIVAASAGSGKSACLIERTVEIVREGTPPEGILTLVYNRAAADELRKRFVGRLGKAIGERVPAFTFHGWAFTQMMRWFPGNFSKGNIVGVDGGPNEIALGREVFKQLGWDRGVEVKDMLGLSGLIRESLIDVEAADAVDRTLAELPLDGDEDLAMMGVSFTRAYQQAKARYGAIDFADMLCIVCRVIDRGGARARELQQRYFYVQADEAQDGNPARWRIATWLGGAATVKDAAPRLLSVGDLRQSLYSFVGARPALFRNRMDAGAALLTLPVNRRSLAPVVDAGNRIARGRDWHLGGDATASRSDEGERVSVWATDADEGTVVADEIKARMKAGLPLADPLTGKANYVLLSRTNGYAAGLEIALMIAGLPVRVLGASGGVWGSNVGRDFLAYLRGAEGIAHPDLVRVANKPNRYLKRALVEEALDAVKDGAELNVALRNTRAMGGMRFAGELGLLADLDWQARCLRVAQVLIDDLTERAATSRRLIAPEDDAKEAYEALAVAATQLGSLEAIEAQIAFMKKVKATEPAVEICTMHRSKGLQWPMVFVCGAAEGILPHKNARDLEEERRIFYVAVTRAQQACIVSTGGAPSPFVYDLDLTPEERFALNELRAGMDD